MITMMITKDDDKGDDKNEFYFNSMLQEWSNELCILCSTLPDFVITGKCNFIPNFPTTQPNRPYVHAALG